MSDAPNKLDKTYSPHEMEARQYDRWERSGAFAPDVGSNAVPYTVMMPPPNVTGSLHMGHALNHTIQDILVRWERMRGRDALWQPGTDHAGIATQMVVERQLGEQGKSRKDLGREAFVARVWEWKAESGGMITRQLRRLGDSTDWSRERFTMDEGLSAAVLKVFVELYRQGLIYKDKRLVNWDPKLETAISDLEVQTRETKGNLWYFRYPVEGEADRFITVATTRPETMLGDTAVAVHPEDPRYTDLVGRFCVLPLVGRRIAIVADEYADPEQGSGAVKITPAHDFNDFEVGRRHGLEMISVIDLQGRINENAPEKYRGLDRFEARKLVVADMEAAELLEKVEPHTHMVPFGDRGGVPIEPLLTEQWYADAATLAKPAIEAVETGRTRFVPEAATKTYYDWMRNIQPWCISRQLWWGHRIPAWYGPDGEIFVAYDDAEAAALAEKHYGEAVALERDPDVLDTWFSSALWPFSTLGWPEDRPEVARYYPGDVLVTGWDILFFWVARMMMMGIHFMGEVPFRTVYLHGLVRDQHGQKMSKSKGNVMDPLDLIEKYGADALRFMFASASAVGGRDVKVSDARVEGYRNFATKLWNAARFCEMNGCVPKPDFEPLFVKQTVNRWIVGKTAQTGAQVDAALSEYRFNEAAAALYQFTWGTFCDWYIEFAKPVLLGEDAAAKAETQATAAWALGRILVLLHPFMPFVTEELAEKLGYGHADGLIRAAWPEWDESLVDAGAAAEMDWVTRFVSEIRGVRSEMNVPPGAKIEALLQGASGETLRRLDTNRDLVSRLARLDTVAPLAGDPPKGAVQVVVDECTIVLPLAGVIDIAAERARLEREIGKVDGEIRKIDGKLGNEAFVAKAPREVVEEQQERREDFTATRERLEAALARLEG